MKTQDKEFINEVQAEIISENLEKRKNELKYLFIYFTEGIGKMSKERINKILKSSISLNKALGRKDLSNHYNDLMELLELNNYKFSSENEKL